RIHRTAVDSPVAIRAIEVESARDARRRSLVRQAVKLRNRGRVDAVVRDWRQVDDDLENRIALACCQHFARWPTPVLLFQTILDVERLACVLREVDDEVCALSHAESNALDFDWTLKQVAVGRDLVKLDARVQIRLVRKEELVEA